MPSIKSRLHSWHSKNNYHHAFLSALIPIDGILVSAILAKCSTALREFPCPSTPRMLRELLGMVNYYHHFFPLSATLNAPLNDLCKGQKKKNAFQKPLEWTEGAWEIFTNVKTLVFQREVHRAITPLTFFSKCLNHCKRKYSAFDRKLLFIFEPILHFWRRDSISSLRTSNFL